MCIPTFTVPSGNGCTEKASSISVVVTSSIEKAATSASGSLAVTAGTGTLGKPAPLGKFSKRNFDRCKSFGEAIPPTASIRRGGVVCNSVHAASSALYSMVFLSGLNNSCSTMGCIEAGKRFCFSSST